LSYFRVPGTVTTTKLGMIVSTDDILEFDLEGRGVNLPGGPLVIPAGGTLTNFSFGGALLAYEDRLTSNRNASGFVELGFYRIGNDGSKDIFFHGTNDYFVLAEGFASGSDPIVLGTRFDPFGQPGEGVVTPGGGGLVPIFPPTPASLLFRRAARKFPCPPAWRFC